MPLVSPRAVSTHGSLGPPVYVVLAGGHCPEVSNTDDLLQDHRGGEVLRGSDERSRSLIHPSEHPCNNSKGRPRSIRAGRASGPLSDRNIFSTEGILIQNLRYKVIT